MELVIPIDHGEVKDTLEGLGVLGELRVSDEIHVAGVAGLPVRPARHSRQHA